MNTVAITGNTYPVKDQIKALGGRWNANQKAWMVPAEKTEAARKLVCGAPKPKFSGYSGNRGYGGYQKMGQMSARTGCSCGSRVDMPRASDCASCQHDY